MKQILLILMVFGSFGAFGADDSLAREFVPLSKYMASADMEDNFSLEFIAKRCSALNLTLSSRWFPEGSEPEKIMKVNYEIFAELAMEARLRKYPAEDLTNTNLSVLKDILRLVDPLDKIMQEQQDKTGSIFEGNWIEDDLNICTSLITK